MLQSSILIVQDNAFLQITAHIFEVFNKLRSLPEVKLTGDPTQPEWDADGIKFQGSIVKAGVTLITFIPCVLFNNYLPLKLSYF